MGTLQKFVKYAEDLPRKDRAELEAALEAIMKGRKSHSLLTPTQEAEDDRRFADKARKTVSQSQIEATAGRPMPS